MVVMSCCSMDKLHDQHRDCDSQMSATLRQPATGTSVIVEHCTDLAQICHAATADICGCHRPAYQCSSIHVADMAYTHDFTQQDDD